MSVVRRWRYRIARWGRRAETFTDRHRWLSIVVALGIVAVPGYQRVNDIATQAQTTALESQATTARLTELFAQQELDRCAARRDTRIVLRALVERVGRSGGGLDLSTIDGFERLDPEIQQFFRNVAEAAASAPSPSAFVTDALALIGDVPVCGDEPTPDPPG